MQAEKIWPEEQDDSLMADYVAGDGNVILNVVEGRQHAARYLWMARYLNQCQTSATARSSPQMLCLLWIIKGMSTVTDDSQNEVIEEKAAVED